MILSGPLLNVENMDWLQKKIVKLVGKDLKYLTKSRGFLHVSTVSLTNLFKDQSSIIACFNDRLMAPLITYIDYLSIGLVR